MNEKSEIAMIVIAEDPKRLKGFLAAQKENDYYYVMLNGSILDFLEIFKEYQIKTIADTTSEYKENFISDYIDYIGNLSSHNNTLYWWATALSSKNQFTSDSYYNVFNYFKVITLIFKNNTKNLIVICDNHELCLQIKKYCKSRSYDVRLLYNKKKNFIKKIRAFFNIFMNIIVFIYQGWYRKKEINKTIKSRIKRVIQKNETYCVLRTWMYLKSISPDYRDSYFGKLPHYMKQSGKNLIVVAGLLDDYSALINKIGKYEEILIIPQEYFVSYFDYITAIIMSFIRFFYPKYHKKFRNEDISNILNAEIRRNFFGGEVRQNLIYYYYIKRMAKKMKILTYIYTYENYPWEKMNILAFRKYSPQTNLVGYQHASISRSHLAYFLSKEEVDCSPLPDKIITNGKETRRIMEKLGNYPPAILKEGCALRFEYLHSSKIFDREKRNFIFVPLTISKYESIKLIDFIHESLSGDKKYNVILRCHPATPFNVIEKDLGFKLSDNFQVSTNINMLDDFERSDIVLYTGTTVCAEALMMGLPVIHMDLGGPLNVDPLFECNYLKWCVKHKEDLITTINDIYNMDNSEFKKQQELARKYVENYFLPVTDELMEEFIKNK